MSNNMYLIRNYFDRLFISTFNIPWYCFFVIIWFFRFTSSLLHRTEGNTFLSFSSTTFLLLYVLVYGKYVFYIDLPLWLIIITTKDLFSWWSGSWSSSSFRMKSDIWVTLQNSTSVYWNNFLFLHSILRDFYILYKPCD